MPASNAIYFWSYSEAPEYLRCLHRAPENAEWLALAQSDQDAVDLEAFLLSSRRVHYQKYRAWDGTVVYVGTGASRAYSSIPALEYQA